MLTFDIPTLPTTAERVTDENISAAIELFFLTKKGVPSHLMDVATSSGIVELTGFTDNLLARTRAEEIALAVRGVRGVVNELVIRTPYVPDADLQADVTRALADDPATSEYRSVRCTVADGVASVEGTVQSWAEQELVLNVLQGVRGVHRVAADDLTIHRGRVFNSDQEITTQIERRLNWDIRVNSALVQVRTLSQHVYLSGKVGTADEKARIVAIAYQTGAARVDARDLEVAYWALGPELRRDKFAYKADADIADAVRDTFRYDPRVLTAEMVVSVREGVVTLTGTVSNLRAKRAAEQDTRNVVGVWDVHTLLKVRTERLSPDADIREVILAALFRDPYLRDVEFRVNVQNGRATLYGSVDNHFEQEQVGEVAAGINGVVDVENRVDVPAPPDRHGLRSVFLSTAPSHPATSPNPDFALTERIQTRYFWSVGLHAQEVQVLVENGRATLTGTVDTWQDRKQAALDAYEVGARDVNNHLRVTTDPRHLGAGL
ncbi:MAG: BON domain-containing protein [Hymenobacteraceae bacterium]|nr:BON domain-containing protein [Hymenobacteraceae bacterium]